MKYRTQSLRGRSGTFFAIVPSMFSQEMFSAGAGAADRSAVLLVEDERISRRALAALLNASGYSTEAVATAEDALRVIRHGQTPPRIALVDLNLPGMNGLDLIDRLRELAPSVYPVLITATGAEALNEALGDRHLTYLRKPVDFDRLLNVLSESQDRH